MQRHKKSIPIALTILLCLGIYGLLKPVRVNDSAVAATDIYVVDGDTLRHDDELIRLDGFNTPEIQFAECDYERQAGRAAKERLRELIDQAANVQLDIKLKRDGDPVRDKYRRLIAVLILDNQNISEIMVSEGYAEIYDGGTRRNWCN